MPTLKKKKKCGQKFNCNNQTSLEMEVNVLLDDNGEMFNRS